MDFNDSDSAFEANTIDFRIKFISKLGDQGIGRFTGTHCAIFKVKLCHLQNPSVPAYYTKTAMGGRLLRNWLLFPLTNLRQIEDRQSRIQTFFGNRTLLEKTNKDCIA